MFYDGDLQSGIGLAIQEQKLVACFVADEGEESQSWENDFLRDNSLKAALSNRTVLLRLNAGSQEAGYLAQIVPLPKTPTFVIIHNGQLKEYLTAGISKEGFLQRLRTILEFPEESLSSETGVSILASSTGPSTEAAAQTEATGSTDVQNLLKERKARLEAQKKEQELKEKADRSAKAKARRQAMDEAAGLEGSQKSADMKYALMQKKRQQEAREERARILKRVEDDKAERREREAARKAQAKATKGVIEDQGPSSTLESSSSKPAATECALQIRLFDGATIRSRFPSSASLRTDVRPWIDTKQKASDVPYTFKHVLTPLPSKNISISDEEQTLQSLELPPSATLILVPVKGAITAYEDANSGIISRGLSTGYNIMSSSVGLVTSTVGRFLGSGTVETSSSEQETSAAGTTPAVNVRTLGNQEREQTEDHQLYNGNALNFEPRRDEDRKND